MAAINMVRFVGGGTGNINSVVCEINGTKDLLATTKRVILQLTRVCAVIVNGFRSRQAGADSQADDQGGGADSLPAAMQPTVVRSQVFPPCPVDNRPVLLNQHGNGMTRLFHITLPLHFIAGQPG